MKSRNQRGILAFKTNTFFRDWFPVTPEIIKEARKFIQEGIDTFNEANPDAGVELIDVDEEGYTVQIQGWEFKNYFPGREP